MSKKKKRSIWKKATVHDTIKSQDLENTVITSKGWATKYKITIIFIQAFLIRLFLFFYHSFETWMKSSFWLLFLYFNFFFFNIYIYYYFCQIQVIFMTIWVILSLKYVHSHISADIPAFCLPFIKLKLVKNNHSVRLQTPY